MITPLQQNRDFRFHIRGHQLKDNSILHWAIQFSEETNCERYLKSRSETPLAIERRGKATLLYEPLLREPQRVMRGRCQLVGGFR